MTATPTPPMPLALAASAELAAALTASVPVPVFDGVPPVIAPPCVAVTDDGEWITPDRVGPVLAYTARFRVVLFTSATDPGTARAAAGYLVDAVLRALPPGALVSPAVSPPRPVDLGSQGSAYVTEIPVTVHCQEGA